MWGKLNMRTVSSAGAAESLSAIERHCGSPIELALLRAMAEAFEDEDCSMTLTPLHPAEFTPCMKLPPGAAFIIPQAVVKDPGDSWSYRTDFLTICGPSRTYWKCYAIECDGYEWHHRTKEQVARDMLRTRRLLSLGIVTVRFSGSELHKKVRECAEYVRDLCYSATGDALFDEYQAKRRNRG